ncbi:MAG: ImmA/IrrE family metallo-endopeptidase [Clostridiales bacterium]|jgi:hypothetical protein|nr:ImmA/IrrE family metallo-endopeptidase [Clostridiales bacterium]
MPPDFQRAAQCAAGALMALKNDAFPITPGDIRRLCPQVYAFEEYGAITRLPVEKLTRGGKLPGATIRAQGGDIVILYDAAAEPPRLLYTLAHELGHVLLGHTRDEDRQEVEAHFFAAHFLMPDELILRLTDAGLPLSAHLLTGVFGVSAAAACKKIHTLQTYGYRRMPQAWAARFEAFIAAAVKKRMGAYALCDFCGKPFGGCGTNICGACFKERTGRERAT